MNLTLRVDATGLARRFTLLAGAAKRLGPALRTFDRYLRARIRARFESQGPGWPPLAQSTEEHREHRAHQAQALAQHRLKRKLTGELKRAIRRQRLGKGTAVSVERRYLVLKEFERQIAGGGLGRQAGADRRLEKSVAGLRDRSARAQAKVSGRLLGRLASSIKSKVSRGTLTVESKVPFAGVHNEGGVGGHGAKIPARPFLFLDEGDVDALVAVLMDHLLIALF